MSIPRIVILLAILCATAWIAMQTFKALALIGVIALICLFWKFKRNNKTTTERKASCENF